MHSEKSNNVAILMATYNGAKYVESQILSLIGQTEKDWTLYIHDDGSTDGTIAILDKYQQIDTRIKWIKDEVTYGSAAKNFMHLLPYANASYIIFCDQDDVWLEHKLEVLLSELRLKDNAIPQAVFSNGYLFAKDKDIFENDIASVKPANLHEQLFLNAGLQGCSLLFNEALANKVKTYTGEVAMHDHLITLTALSFGQIHYIDRRLMLYRQNHAEKATSNVVLGKTARIKGIFNNALGVLDRKHYLATRAFFEFFKNQLNAESVLLFEAYLRYADENSIFKRLNIIMKNRFVIDKSMIKLLAKTIIRPKFS